MPRMIHRLTSRVCLVLPPVTLILSPVFCHSAEPRITRDVEYAREGDISLKLDLYVPAESNSPPLVVWVHGGAYKRQGLSATFEVVYGGVHGGKLFYTPQQIDQVADFLDRSRAGKSHR
jgi:hypothetical protein